jgi:plastocyanin
MGKIARLGLLPLIFAAACADDEFQPPPSPIDAAIVDSPQGIDALELDAAIDAAAVDAGIDAMSSVSVVTCPVTPDLEIAVNGGGTAYMPNTGTISVNGVIRFTPGDPNHDMVSGTAPNADGLFDTVAGDTVCLRFSAAGTFPFFCQVHGFTGTLTVN